MKKILVLTTVVTFCMLSGTSAQNVFNPNDPVVTYNPSSPPAIPSQNKISKWVRSVHVDWNTDRFKPYYYNDMAMRLRYPNGYNPADATKKYPIIVFFHGNGEVDNVTDNELQLLNGAKLFEQKINGGEFNAFMLFPQVRKGSGWDYSYYLKTIDILDSLEKYCHVDLDRVICMGVSNGALGALTFSSVSPQRSATIIGATPALIQLVTPNIDNIIHIPEWLVSGGTDVNPEPAPVKAYVNAFNAKGGDLRYNLYGSLGHVTWDAQWNEPYLVPYWKSAHKANPLVYYKKNKFNSGKQIDARLGISPGFYQYEWSRDNVVISGATSNELNATKFGTYRVHFKRKAGAGWSDWSPVPVVIAADDIAPSVPASLKVDYSGRNFITLDWDNSTDNDAVAGYEIYINGKKKFTTAGSAITIDDLQPNTAYTFNVIALDQAGNASAVSSPLNATPGPGVAGLNYRYFEGDWNQLPDFNALTPVKIGASPNADLSPRNVNDNFGFVWEGYINIPASGDYTFELVSDDGSMLFLNSFYSPTETPLVNYDDVHDASTAFKATVNIPAAGAYPFALTYFNKNQGRAMEVYWTGPGIKRQLIPNSAFGSSQADASPPSTPANLRVTGTGSTYLDLAWDNSYDNVGVTSYEVYVNDQWNATTATPGVTVKDLSPKTNYKITIRAFDKAGNASDFSKQENAKTSDDTPGGLQYRYYEGNWNQLPDFNALTPVKKGTTPNIDLEPRNVNDYFGFIWEGYITIPTAGRYTFETVSDDGSKVYFNTTYSVTAQALVNNDGIHGPWSAVAGSVNVPAAGTYPIAVTFFEKNVGEAMELYWSGPGISRQLVPNSAFVRTAGVPASTGSVITRTGALTEATVTETVAGIYPNPFRDKVYVGLTGVAPRSNVEVNIYDLNGKLMLRRYFGQVPAGSSTLQLDVSGKKLNPGIYLMRTSVNGIPSTATKIIKTR